MAELIASIKTNLYDDKTVSHVVTFYTDGKNVGTKELDGPTAEDVAHHLAFDAPAGHVLVPSGDFTDTGQPLVPVEDLLGGTSTSALPEVAPRTIPADTDEAKTNPAFEPLPDTFPGKQALAEAGITTYEQVRALDDLTKIAGIGAATAAKIEEALEA